MRRAPNRPSIALLCSLGLAACGDATRSAREGTILASTVTTGPGPTSYSLRVGSQPPRSLGANDSVVIEGVAVGSYSVGLGEVPSYCQASGPNPRPIVVEGAGVTRVAFAVSCAPTGSLETTVRTTGPDADPNGYEVVVKGVNSTDGAALGLGPNATGTIDFLRPGTFDVALQGAAENCAVGGGATRRVSVSTGATSVVEYSVSCAPAAQIAFARDGQIVVARSNGTLVTPRTTSGLDSDPVWSPDGGRIAFSRDGFVMVMAADGTNVVRLSSGVQPTWSPDGRRLAAGSSHPASPRFIYTLSVDPADPASRLVASNALAPAWSPDGRRIAFVRSIAGDGEDEIAIANADGTNLVQMTSGGGYRSRPAWSPDGLELAFATCHESCVVHILSDDGRLQRTLEGGGAYEVAWSPDGRTLAVTVCTDGPGGCPSIRYLRVDGSYSAPIVLDGDGPSWKP